MSEDSSHKRMDNCILKMINVDPNKRHSSLWDLITDLDMMK